MQWPDIFFKAKKLRSEDKPSPAPQPVLVTPKNTPTDLHPPEIKPVPVVVATKAAPTPAPQKNALEEETATPTLSAAHGIVLRPPVWPSVPAKDAPNDPATAAPADPAPYSSAVKNIEELMAEADPLRAISQTSAIRLLKRSAPETDASNGKSKTLAESTPAKSEPNPASAASASPTTPVATATIAAPPAPKTAPTPPPTPAPPAKPLMPFGSIFRRKAKMTELARIVLPPPKHEESVPAHAPAGPSPTVVPAAFPVAAMTARAGQLPAAAAHDSHTETGSSDNKPSVAPEPEKTAAPATASAPTPVAETKPVAPLPNLSDAPKVDPESHKPDLSTASLPKIDPEAHKPAPTPAAPAPSTALSTPAPAPEKREFHLANGEHVAGTVLSETPEAVYFDHPTLGVITIPRAQIAKRLIEIILINGDRIVGDIMAETADTLYVRHASLGMLTVPRAQRSTRVVEAILNNGDRILGEVLSETDAFTVIRSATLGTVTIPHGKMSMLNRKIEQIELKALPSSAPQIKDKPSG